ALTSNPLAEPAREQEQTLLHVSPKYAAHPYLADDEPKDQRLAHPYSTGDSRQAHPRSPLSKLPVSSVIYSMCGLQPSATQIEHLHEHGEAHREVHVSL